MQLSQILYLLVDPGKRNFNKMTFQKFNPATGALLATYQSAGLADIAEILQKARNQVTAWSGASLRQRARVLAQAAKTIREQADYFAELIAAETGKSLADALAADVAVAVGVLSYYATHGPGVLKSKFLPVDKSILMGRLHQARRCPRGVSGVVSPWNFPLAIPASGLATALMAGNPVILKPSELAPGTGLALVALFQKILNAEGFSPEVVQYVLGDGVVGKQLVDSLEAGGLDYVIFTGSTTVGHAIRNEMQARGKAVSLELGGSDPMLILDGADLDAATSYALWGRFNNAGQACAAVKRLLVPRHHGDAALAMLKTKIEQVRPQMGPVISESHRQVLLSQLRDLIENGANLVVGGHPTDHPLTGEPGYFLEPTVVSVVDVVTPASQVSQMEVFGPLLIVTLYDDLSQAIALANDTPYGLTACVFGPLENARGVAQHLQAGCVLINDTGATNYALPAVPWQGWKNSGPGVSHSAQALLDATLLQVVTENWLYQLPLLRKQPWHFGKQPANTNFAKALIAGFSSECWLDKLKPGLWWEIWKNRSSTRV